jgi:hypothetical protein
MLCAPRLIFSGAECVGSRFHVLCSRTHFRRYRGRWLLFSCFEQRDPFSAIPRSSGPVFMFCAPRLDFGGTEGAGSGFHVLRSRARFRRYGGRLVSISSFACPDSFCYGIEGVVSRFHVLRSRTLFRRCRVRRVPFSCFAHPGLIFSRFDDVHSCFHVFPLPDMFLAVRRSSGPVFLFALSDTFSAEPRALGPVFMFRPSELVFSGISCSCFFARRLPFSCFFVPGLFFGGTEGAGSRVHVLRSRTHFMRYRGRRGDDSHFARSD